MTKEIFADDIESANPLVQKAINEAEARGEILTSMLYNPPTEKYDGVRVLLTFGLPATDKESRQ